MDDLLADCWKFFDRIYCISLHERADRQKHAGIQFDRVGLADKVEFVMMKKHPQDCEKGIYESHLACIARGLQAGANTMVIFEDDILFDRFRPVNLKACIDFLKVHPDWNAFFFGCLVSGSRRTTNKSVLKITYRCLAHAYVLNRKFAEKIAKIPWQGIPFDAMLNSSAEGYYAAYPSFAFQNTSRSDNIRFARLDKFRRLCGGLWRIQKLNEFYHHHKVAILMLHLILAGILLQWVFS
jgi:GR25 family glycosyltransferase involved in LPS biosynthesis